MNCELFRINAYLVYKVRPPRYGDQFQYRDWGSQITEQYWPPRPASWQEGDTTGGCWAILTRFGAWNFLHFRQHRLF